MRISKKEEIARLSRKAAKIGFFVAVCLIVVLCGALAAYAYNYSNRVPLNSHFQGENISGLNRQQLKEKVDKLAESSQDRKIKLIYQDKSWELSFADASWQLNTDKTVEQIFSFAHSGNRYTDARDFIKSVFVNSNFDISYSFNESLVLDWLASINDEIGKSKVETNIIIKNDEAQITDSQTGETINDDEIKQAMIDRFKLSKTGDVEVKIIEDKPNISKEEAQSLVDSAKKLVSEKILIVGPNGEVDWSKNFLGSIIELKRKNKKSFVHSDKLGDVYVSFSDSKIKAQLREDASVLNKAAQDAKLTVVNGQVTISSGSSSGREFIPEDSANLLVEELEKGQNKRIVLPDREQKPSISGQTTQDIANLGIKELIGTATTDFRKSSTSRIHNIEMGVKYISGAIIKPGEEFSTIARLGSIDQSGGYLPELVIKGDKTIPEFGGELCQVSTTLFRSTMNAGLKITARQNHSYRVSYYEPPVGMDATVYSPNPDFKFVNNTDTNILLYGHIEGTKITFDIYGTKDGRVSEVTDPVIYETTNPSDPIYTDDPSLAPGEIKQTDKAHVGAKTYFYYTVKKNGAVLVQNKFTSSYVAWPARYLRGPAVQAENTSAPAETTSTPAASVTSSP